MAVDDLFDSNSGNINLTLETIVAKIRIVNDNNDIFFVVIMATMVFLMQCGFAFLEAGSVRSKNTTNILIKNLLDSCISAICYYTVGWAFAYGEPSNAFIGHGEFALAGIDPDHYKNWFFQFVFAAAASTIVSGALAERCEFCAYFGYCGLLTSFAFPVITHWVWAPGGWLSASAGILKSGVGMKDFAGSGVVHLHGGSCALVGAYILGPRIGRFPNNGLPSSIKGHSVPFAALGGFLLMFGFFAFNGGSQISITNDGDGKIVALAMINTMLSGGAAAVTGLFINMFSSKHWSLLLSINTALAGMVAICSGCDSMYPWGALVTGVGSAVVCILLSHLMVKLKIDDPLDAVAVHLGGGLWGVLSSPFLIKEGIFFGGENSGLVLAMNCIGALAIFVWSVALIGGLFFIMNKLKIFRVSAEVETKGLDRVKHGEDAYPLIAYGHGWGDDHIIEEDEDNGIRMQRKISRSMEDPRLPRLPLNNTAWMSNNISPVPEDKALRSQQLNESDSERASSTHYPSPTSRMNNNTDKMKNGTLDSNRGRRIYPSQQETRNPGEVYYPETMYHNSYPAIAPRPGSYPGWYNYYR